MKSIVNVKVDHALTASNHHNAFMVWNDIGYFIFRELDKVSSAKQDENGSTADLLITLKLSKYNLLNVKKLDEDKLAKIGLRSAIRKISKSRDFGDVHSL